MSMRDDISAGGPGQGAEDAGDEAGTERGASRAEHSTAKTRRRRRGRQRSGTATSSQEEPIPENRSDIAASPAVMEELGHSNESQPIPAAGKHGAAPEEGEGESGRALELDELATVGTDNGLASTDPALPGSGRRRRRHIGRGAVIGRFIVVDSVGAGTMGTVYSAYDPQLDRRIALKLLSTHQARSSKARARLMREARALAKLSHPNVVQVYDVGEQGDDVFVAMELIAGKSLGECCQAQPRPSWREVLDYYLAAARGLAAAHAVGLIHRDFKPSNVLVGYDGRVCVADFGLAAAIQRKPNDTAVPGLGEASTEQPFSSSMPGLDLRRTIGDREDDSDELDASAFAATAGGAAGPDHAAGPDQASGAGQSGADAASERSRGATEPDVGAELGGDIDVDAEARTQLGGPDLGTLDPDDLRATLPRPPTSPWRGSANLHLTESNTIMGTPAFMAPEQHSGEEIGPLSDAYSFCVSLYMGLYGELPFEVNDKQQQPMMNLLSQKAREQIRPAPPHSDVPEWLRQVLVRGLAARPEHRWPSMNALIAELEDDPAIRRRRRLRQVAAGVGLALLVGLAAWGWLRAPAQVAERVCGDAEQHLSGVWDQDMKRRIRSAFLATPLPYAATTFERVSHQLDSYADGWTEMHDEACEATHVREEQSPQTLDLRIFCLEQRRSRMHALTELFSSEATARVVDNSISEAMALPPLDPCADIEALMATVRPPEDPQIRARVEELQHRLDRAATLADGAGRYEEAQVEALDVLDDSQAVPYPPLRARAMFAVAELHRRLGAYERSEELLRELLPLAARVGDDELVALAWVELLWGIGYRQKRPGDAMALALPAETAVERADDELLRADLWLTLGAIVSELGDFEAAANYERRALDAKESVFRDDGVETPHPDVAQARNNLAASLVVMGRDEEALPLLESALAIRVQVLGDSHPLVAQSKTNLARALSALGRVREALTRHSEAIAILEAGPGEPHWMLGFAYERRGRTLLDSGDPEAARVAFERALEIYEATQGQQHRDVAEPLIGLAQVALIEERAEDALLLLERALTLSEGTDGDVLARVRFALARALRAAGRESARVDALATRASSYFGAIGNDAAQAEVEAFLASPQGVTAAR
ncbi:serine/threonine-protein kinase [Haliangium ochraceum]|nr:serine/threonine-protein kinase [Haliangium ochraceum]